MDIQSITVQLNALKQCINMYEVRGWTVSDDLKKFITGLTLADYIKIHDNSIGRSFDGISKIDGSNVVPVFLIFIQSDGKKKESRKTIDETVIDIISRNGLTGFDKKRNLLDQCHITVIFLTEIKKTDFDKFSEDQEKNIEFFQLKHASLDILGYKYQPKFTLYRLSTQSDLSSDIYKKYGKMCIDDPVVKYFYAQPEDVFKIERRSYTGASTTYRIVKNIKMNEIKIKTTANERGVDVDTSMSI